MRKLLASLLGISLLVAATGCILGPRDEKQAFIDATVEATCHIFQAENLFDPAVEQEAKDIYKKYGFDADDQEGMQAIANKYAEDEDVKNAIMEEIKKCSEGIPGLDGLAEMSEEDLAALEEEAGEALEEEVPAEETPAEEVPVAELPPADAPEAEVPAVEGVEATAL